MVPRQQDGKLYFLRYKRALLLVLPLLSFFFSCCWSGVSLNIAFAWADRFAKTRALRKLVLALLSIQIVYKLLNPILVGTLTNPVIICNILIALFHSYSVWKIALSEKINL
jgi:hypothetical protein